MASQVVVTRTYTNFGGSKVHIRVDGKGYWIDAKLAEALGLIENGEYEVKVAKRER